MSETIERADLLPEDQDERRKWDDTCHTLGWSGLQRVAAMLAAMHGLAPNGGSYKATMAIAYNEVRKAIAATPPQQAFLLPLDDTPPNIDATNGET